MKCLHKEEEKTTVVTSGPQRTLKSGCLSLLKIRVFGARDGLGLSVRVWLGFGLGLSVRAIDSLTDTV